MGYKGLAPPGSLSHSPTQRCGLHITCHKILTGRRRRRRGRGGGRTYCSGSITLPSLLYLLPTAQRECGLLRQETEGGGGLQLLTDKFRPHPRLCIIPSDVMFSMFQRHYVIKTSIKTAVRYSPVETEKANIEICHGNIPHQEQVVTIRIGRPHLKHKPRCLPSPARPAYTVRVTVCVAVVGAESLIRFARNGKGRKEGDHS